MGTPQKYTPEMMANFRKMVERGATVEQIADAFGASLPQVRARISYMRRFDRKALALQSVSPPPLPPVVFRQIAPRAVPVAPPRLEYAPIIGHARTCQWIEGREFACTQSSADGWSYCEEHRARVYINRHATENQSCEASA